MSKSTKLLSEIFGDDEEPSSFEGENKVIQDYINTIKETEPNGITLDQVAEDFKDAPYATQIKVLMALAKTKLLVIKDKGEEFDDEFEDTEPLSIPVSSKDVLKLINTTPRIASKAASSFNLNEKMDIYEVDDCGCNGPKLILKEGHEDTPLSEGILYHVREGRQLIHNIYRPLSKNYFALVREARDLYNKGILSVTEDDAELLESNLGEFGIYNGVRVPLDYIFEIEELKNMIIKEGLEDTSWTGEKGQKITLTQLLDAIKDYPIIQAPIDKVEKVIIKKDSGGIESDRLSAADVKYPIIIVIDDNENYKYVLDGNHRANKAISAGLKSIPAKLVNIKDLPQEFQDVLSEAKSKAKKKLPPIGKPKRGGSKKFYVYVRKPGGGVKKVSFGMAGGGLRAKLNNPKARRAFAQRHKCAQAKDRTTARYWSCRLPRYAKLLGFKTSFSGFW